MVGSSLSIAIEGSCEGQWKTPIRDRQAYQTVWFEIMDRGRGRVCSESCRGANPHSLSHAFNTQDFRRIVGNARGIHNSKADQ
ncbi:hypothetical protein PLANTIT3_80110 [Plantibacter sp. T3]|nr:hypothetical protein PLANTIT3_80110 [Plantibacter sp. T3]